MKNPSTRYVSLAAAMFATTLLQACAGTMQQNAQLSRAQNDYDSASSNPKIVQTAPEQLRDASGNLQQAEALMNHGAPQDEVDHYAHLVSLNVTAARELADASNSEAYVREAGDRRTQMQLKSSQQQTEQARRETADAHAQAASAGMQASQAQQQAEQAQRETADANAQAASAGAQADQAQQQNAALLAALDAKQTDRGMVLTLGGVLFDSNEASLSSGGDRSLDKLAQFLRDNPKRNVRVQGYTDSTGTAAQNLELSQRRADTVRSALVEDGLDAQRATTKGFGQDFAVASNQTSSGRQQNRRVEVVISDADGTFPTTH
jgi:outer membrane protein OmpA-like peptidoglycan-associated protein